MDEEIKDGEGAREGKSGKSGGKRLIGMAVMLLLLVLSSASIFVFLRHVEPAGARTEEEPALSGGRGGDDYVPSSGIKAQLPSPDMLPQRRRLITDELNRLLEGTVSRVEETADGAVRWIRDKTTPKAATTAAFYVYLGSGSDTIWGRLAAGYFSMTPVHANRMTLDVDGTVYAVGIRHDNLRRRDLDYIRQTNESVDLPLDDYAAMLRHVGNGKNVFVCFQNGEREHRFQLTRAQIDAVARMMRILRVREELDEDRRAQALR